MRILATTMSIVQWALVGKMKEMQWHCKIKMEQNGVPGSLVNDECQDLRSFFLTAFSLSLILIIMGNLSNQRKGEQYAFRFKYEAETPTCREIAQATRNMDNLFGAAFRANNATILHWQNYMEA